MTSVLYRLGHLCVRRRWIVLGLWITVFVGPAVVARSVGPNTNWWFPAVARRVPDVTVPT